MGFSVKVHSISNTSIISQHTIDLSMLHVDKEGRVGTANMKYILVARDVFIQHSFQFTTQLWGGGGAALKEEEDFIRLYSGKQQLVYI